MGHRRANGEGSITERANGTFMGRASWTDETGNPQRTSVYGRTRPEAVRKLNQLKRDIERGITPVDDERLTVGAFLDSWLERTVEPNLKPRTHELYAGLVRNHIQPAVGRRRLNMLTPRHVQEMLEEMRKKKLSASTRRAARSVLLEALQEALTFELVHCNVAALVQTPRSDAVPREPYSLEETVTLLEASRGHRLGAAISVAIMTGMRRGETAGLRWQDILWDHAQVRVAGSLQRIGGRGLVWASPKTRESNRYVDVQSDVLVSLRAHMARQLREREVLGAAWLESDYIFRTTVGTPLDPHKLWSEFRLIAKKAGLEAKPFHVLRHGYATLQMEVGAPASVVQRLLGHTRVSTTLDIYSHVSKRLQRENVERFGRLFDGTTPPAAGQLVSELVYDSHPDTDTIALPQ